MAGGLALTFGLGLATANQFLEGAIPTAFSDALRVDGLSAWSSSCARLSASVRRRHRVSAPQRGARTRDAPDAP